MTNQHRKKLLLGIAFASSLAISTAIVTTTRANEPRCYLQTRDGKRVDLTKLCNKKAPPTSSMPQTPGVENPAAATGDPQKTVNFSNTRLNGKIDPNAPADNRQILRDKPSALWHTIPDLPYPPKKGATSR